LQNPNTCDLLLFQKKLDQFINKVDKLLPVPGFRMEPISQNNNHVGGAVEPQKADAVDDQKVSGEEPVTEKDHEETGESVNETKATSDAKNVDNAHSPSNKTVSDTNDMDDTDNFVGNHNYDDDEDDEYDSAQSNNPTSPKLIPPSSKNAHVEPAQHATGAEDEKKDDDEKEPIENERKSSAGEAEKFPSTTDDSMEEPPDEMESSMRDLQAKRAQLKNRITEDPMIKSLEMASQAQIRSEKVTEYASSESDDEEESPKQQKVTKVAQKDQKRDDDDTNEKQNDETRNNKAAQAGRNQGQSALYANKRSRSQVQWDGSLGSGEHDSHISDDENDTKKIKTEHVEFKTRKRPKKFTDEEKNAIKEGVNEKGFGNWAKIKEDIKYKEILKNRTAVQIKDAYRTMKKNNEVE